MKKNVLPIILVIATLALAALACGGSFSTAKISSAVMTKDPSSTASTVSFAQDDTFYCIAKLANAPDDTKVKAVWYAVDVESVEANTLIDQAEMTGSDQSLTFKLTNSQLWPAGKYKVELYLNDKLDKTLEFTVG